MANLLNTHHYDGKLNLECIPKLTQIQELTLEQKKEKGMALLSLISKESFPFLDKIIQDIGSPANFDFSNNLRADDLICLCWDFKENPDFIFLLNEQLMGMATGFCPQGRTHRLFQLILAFTN